MKRHLGRLGGMRPDGSIGLLFPRYVPDAFVAPGQLCCKSANGVEELQESQGL